MNPGLRVAVLVRVYDWDEHVFRSVTRIWNQSDGLDFYILADETGSGPLDVGPFPKLGHDVAYFERLGLPCGLGEQAAPLWWNCDYGLYDAALRLPDYDFYLLIESDVAVNLKLRPLVEQVVEAGVEALTPFAHRPGGAPWRFAGSCAELPYARKTRTPLCIMLFSRRVACHLLHERLRVARLRARGQITSWAFCEGFVSSALVDAGFRVAALDRMANLQDFGTESVYLEGDERTRLRGSFCHAVLDPGRFWRKFVGRAFRTMLASADYEALRGAREQLIRAGRVEHQGWRIANPQRSLALDRPARQSSVSSWSRRGQRRDLDPNALDARGANCGVLTGNRMFHTEFEQHPWWAVDLGGPRAIDEIRVTNGRQVPERARRLMLQVSDDGATWKTAFRKSDDRVFVGNDEPLVFRPSQPLPARHVRVLLDGPGVLHLAQVEVFGDEA